MPRSIAGLGLLVLSLCLAAMPLRAAEGLGELEEPGQVERLPVDEPAPTSGDANVPGGQAGSGGADDPQPALEEKARASKMPVAGGGDEESGKDDSDDSQSEEAVTLLPDSEAIDETIDDTPEQAEARREGRAVPEPSPGADAQAKPERSWSIRWQNAFIIERTDDARYQFLFGGKIQNDWGLYQPDNDLEDSYGGDGTGTKFRRARLYFQGQFFRFGFFKAEYDFSEGTDGTAFADVYAGLNLPKLGLLRVGYFKEPFSLEFLGSSNFLSFNERSSSDVFSPGRNSGIMLNGNFLIRDSTYAVAVMRRTDDIGEGFSNNEDYHITTRLTALPFFEDGGARLFHVEFGYSHQFADKEAGTEYIQRPANDFAADVVDTTLLPVENVDLFNLGLAWVQNSLSIQSEFTLTIPRGEMNENPLFWGAYAEVSWWITGENRRYLRGRGVFSRVVPKSRFDPEAGHWGAFELAARYSWLDLSNDGIRGGTLEEWSLALNWVLFSNLRMSNNFVLSRTGDRPSIPGESRQSGIAHSWVTRFQIDF